MERCPRCRAKYNPSYTVECSNCGALLMGVGPGRDGLDSGGAGSALPSATEWHAVPAPDGPRGVRKAVRSYFAMGAPFLGWVIVGALGLGGVAASMIAGAGRDEGGTIVDQGVVGVFEARVGDCLNLRDDELDADLVTEFVGIPCDQPHGMEVFALVPYPAAPNSGYPGREVLEQFADDTCVILFEGYVGVPFAREPFLGVTFFTPEPDGWEQGDHEVTCALVTVDGSNLETSMEGNGMIHHQDLEVGCYDFPADPDQILGLYPRPCGDPHDLEVYSVIRERSSNAADFDEARLIEFGDRECNDELVRFLGPASADPDLVWAYLWPNEESWADRDRRFICFVERADGTPLTGSVAGGAEAGAVDA